MLIIIYKITEPFSILFRDSRNIRETFAKHFRQKYQILVIFGHCFKLKIPKKHKNHR